MLIDLTASDDEADELRRAPQRAQPHDLTASDDDADERQRAKRARLQAGSAAGGSGAPSTSAALPPPFKLLRTCAEVGAAPAHTATLEGLTAGEWEYALFSNYLICPAWLTSACEPLTRCPLVLLAPSQRAGGAVSRWANSTLGSERARVHLVCPPLPDQYGSHHAKFLLLFSKTGVRVVIHTANALYHDVRDMTQGVWSQDFPRRRGAPAAEGGACQFGRALVAYLREALRETPRLELRRAGGPPIAFSAESLLAYDFSGAEAHLLASVPGRHTGASLPLWGLAQLSALLRAEPAAAAPRGRSAPLSSEVCGQDEILLQFSSFSSVGAKAKFWHEMVGALSTQPATSGLPARPLRAHVVWPTEEEVRGCHLGYGGGGSLPAQRANVEKVSRSEEPALRGSLCTWTSPSGAHSLGRGRFTAHLKSYLRFDPDSRRVAWLVLTSANLSMAAWCARAPGRLTPHPARLTPERASAPPRAGARTKSRARSSSSAPTSWACSSRPPRSPKEAAGRASTASGRLPPRPGRARRPARRRRSRWCRCTRRRPSARRARCCARARRRCRCRTRCRRQSTRAPTCRG